MVDTLDVFHLHVERKLNLARQLAGGACGGDYSDACILIAALISGVAADLWPGSRIDRHRFVETWSRYGRDDLQPTRISLPLLARRLRKAGRTHEAATVEALRPGAFGPGNSSKVVIGEEVDASETEVLQAAPTLTLAEVRKRSYPNVFYEHVRSSLTHEYHLDNRATGMQITEQVASVSYANFIVAGSATLPQRRIHFHLEWLLDVVRSIAEASSPDLLLRPLEPPKPWWLQG